MQRHATFMAGSHAMFSDAVMDVAAGEFFRRAISTMSLVRVLSSSR